jgi:hypothetical protein
MYIYDNYFVITHEENERYFLTEDCTFTTQLNCALKFVTNTKAAEHILNLNKLEEDDDFSGDYKIANKLEIKEVIITVK